MEVNGGAKSEYLLARRSMSILPISLSIAAAWMWAPALMVAATLGYIYGAWGVFWFAVPNIIAVLIMGPVAVRARKRLPDGVTYAGFQRRAHSRRVLGLFMAQDAMALFTNMLANTIAAGFVFEYVFGLPFLLGAFLILLIPMLYVLPGGFRISTITDVFTMTVIVGIVVLVAFGTIAGAGVSTLLDGFAGSEGYTAAFIAAGLGVTLSIHLLSSPYSDQTLWQRAWAAKREDVSKAFLLGGLFFAPVPILAGAVGVVAAGAGLALSDPQAALFAGAEQYLGAGVATVLGIAVLLAVIDTLDSCMNAVSAFVSDDNTIGLSVNAGRLVMVGMTAVVLAVSTLNIPILSVQLLYGALLGAVLLPGLITLFSDRLPAEPAVFWASIIAAVIGIPVFIFGLFGGGGDLWTAAGKVLTLAIGGVLTVLLSRYVYSRGIRATPEPAVVLAD